MLPTTQREFTQADSLAGFVRIYQGGTKELQTASLSMRIVDSRERAVFEQRHSIEAGKFGADRAFDFQFEKALKDLQPGAYVLELNVAGADRETSSRAVRFGVVVGVPRQTRLSEHLVSSGRESQVSRSGDLRGFTHLTKR